MSNTYDNNQSSNYEDSGLGYSKASSFHPHKDVFSNEDVPGSGFSFQQQPCQDPNNTNERSLSDSLHDASYRHRFIQGLLEIAAPAFESHHTQSVDTGTSTPTSMPSNEATLVDYSNILDVLTNNNNTSSPSHHLGAGNISSSQTSFPDNNYSTSPFVHTGSTSRRVDENHHTNDNQWQQQHYSDKKLPYSQYKMTSNPSSKRSSLEISLDEVEALLNLETFHPRKNSTSLPQKNRRSSANFLESLLPRMQSHTSFSQLFHSQDDEMSSNNNNFMDVKDRANASFDNFNPHVVTPTCTSKQPSLLSSLLDQFSDQEMEQIGAHFISDMNTEMNVSPNNEVTSSVLPPPMNTSTDHHEARSSPPVPSSQCNSLNPLDMESPYFDVSFATKYRTNLKALVSRMEQTSKSRNGLEEVKRHLNYSKKEVDATKKERLDIYDVERNNTMTVGTMSTTSAPQHYPHYPQPNATLSYTAIKHSRRQQKTKKKKKVCSATKSSQVTMKKKKVGNVSCRTHNRSFTPLKLYTPENIFG